MIQQGFERATSVKREELLIPKIRAPSDPTVRFISSYNILYIYTKIYRDANHSLPVMSIKNFELHRESPAIQTG